ncbi:MAG: N-formylglutamate amidohydrolase, partial [Parvularculaceae bacterium]
PIRSVGGIDFVLGDRYGAACASGLTSLCEALLTERGYRTARNAPYAGGFITAKFGQPHRGVHAVQIEINRALYLDEDKVSRHSGFPTLRRSMRGVFSDLVQLDPAALELARAAE